MSWLAKRQANNNSAGATSSSSHGIKEGNGKKINNVLKAAFRGGSSSSASLSLSASTTTTPPTSPPADHVPTTKPRSQTVSVASPSHSPSPLNLSSSTSSASRVPVPPPSPSRLDPFANLYGTTRSVHFQPIPGPDELDDISGGGLGHYSLADEDHHYHHSQYEQPANTNDAARRRALSNPSGPVSARSSTAGIVGSDMVNALSLNGNLASQQQQHYQQSARHRHVQVDYGTIENNAGSRISVADSISSQGASVRSVLTALLISNLHENSSVLYHLSPWKFFFLPVRPLALRKIWGS